MSQNYQRPGSQPFDSNKVHENPLKPKRKANGHDPTPPDSDALRLALEMMNRRYMVINEGGKVFIFEPRNDPILNRRYFIRIRPADFEVLWMNRRWYLLNEDTGKSSDMSLARIWLRDAKRRQFPGGIGLYPAMNAPADVYNLWEGFNNLKPAAGNWSLLQTHLHDLTCNGHTNQYDYLLNWLARSIQLPGKQAETAVVIAAGEGAGKTILGRAMLRIFGQHGFAISHSRHLTGNFNRHLRDCIFLLGDEAYFAGDKQGASMLRALITEPMIAIEGKGVDVVNAPNFLHLMLTANADWVIPAATDDRRYLVLRASEAKVGDRDYFNALWHQLEQAGGIEAMLHDLQSRDISGFDVRDVPKTEGLQQQKKLSLKTEQAWWMDCLHRGFVFDSRLGLGEFFSQWLEAISMDLLYASYDRYAREHNERHRLPRETLARFIKTMGGKPIRADLVIGEQIRDGGGFREAAVLRKPRATGYHLSTLDHARVSFCTLTKLAVEWENGVEYKPNQGFKVVS